jgi:PKD repeat protein
LNDPTDEIVYFTWDFGDGTVRTNLSQSVITHTYKYDYEKDNGVFKPSVQILTKKGRSITIGLEDDIIVKKAIKDVLIRVDSHPAQVVRIGEKVDFSLDISGLPQRIIRDFGNGSTIELPGRQGTSISHIFTENKNYMVKAIVEYENQPRVE